MLKNKEYIVLPLIFISCTLLVTCQTNDVESDSYKSFNFEKNLQFNYDALNNITLEGVQFITFINQNGCSSCITSEIKILNQKYFELQDRLHVIYVGSNPDFLKDKGANFNYNSITSLSDILITDPHIYNPFTIILDNNFIYDLRIVDPAKPFSEQFSKSYYQKLIELSDSFR